MVNFLISDTPLMSFLFDSANVGPTLQMVLFMKIFSNAEEKEFFYKKGKIKLLNNDVVLRYIIRETNLKSSSSVVALSNGESRADEIQKF